MMKSCPSVWPSYRMPCTNAPLTLDATGPFVKKAMRRVLPHRLCASAPSGVISTTPSRIKISRRLICPSLHVRREPNCAELRLFYHSSSRVMNSRLLLSNMELPPWASSRGDGGDFPLLCFHPYHSTSLLRGRSLHRQISIQAMSQMGHQLTFGRLWAISAGPSIADIRHLGHWGVTR